MSYSLANIATLIETPEESFNGEIGLETDGINLKLSVSNKYLELDRDKVYELRAALDEYLYIEQDRIAQWLLQHNLYQQIYSIKFNTVEDYLYPRVEGSVLRDGQLIFWETGFPPELPWLKDLYEYLGKPVRLYWRTYAGYNRLSE